MNRETPIRPSILSRAELSMLRRVHAQSWLQVLDTQLIVYSNKEGAATFSGTRNAMAPMMQDVRKYKAPVFLQLIDWS